MSYSRFPINLQNTFKEDDIICTLLYNACARFPFICALQVVPQAHHDIHIPSSHSIHSGNNNQAFRRSFWQISVSKIPHLQLSFPHSTPLCFRVVPDYISHRTCAYNDAQLTTLTPSFISHHTSSPPIVLAFFPSFHGLSTTTWASTNRRKFL